MGKANLLHYLPRERKQNYGFNGPGLPFCVVNVCSINIIKAIPGAGIGEHSTLGNSTVVLSMLWGPFSPLFVHMQIS